MTMNRSGRRSLVVLSAAALCLGAGHAPARSSIPAAYPRLLSSGLIGVGDPAGFAREVLAPGRSPGPDRFGPALLSWPRRTDVDPAAARAWEERWAATGTLPGRTPAERDAARAALIHLALLTDPSGASIACPVGAWNYAWPRDAAWHTVAFAVTGHLAEAGRILGFFARVQDRDGTWAARYHGDGAPVSDGRARQLDAVGWLPWATWHWWRAGAAVADVRALWPMVSAAADAATRSMRADGLPRASSDYTEQAESRRTIGTAAPLLLGLRSAADLATSLGHLEQARRWGDAAVRLDAAITSAFGTTGHRRHPQTGAGPDSAITFRASPLATPTRGEVYRTVVATSAELLMASGGLRPGNMPRVRRHTFTPATALFALAAAGAGDEAGFRRWFDWLLAHRTARGAFPEKVNPDGAPASVAPLGWTSAIVVLALAARDGRVPMPPAGSHLLSAGTPIARLR